MTLRGVTSDDVHLRGQTWQLTREVTLLAVQFAQTWRACYPDCHCERCSLAAAADRLVAHVMREAARP